MYISMIERITRVGSYMIIDRDDYLNELSRSDLSVEELLAEGADVSALVSAGVLHDDYPAGHDFTEAPEPQKYDGPPMSDEEFEYHIALGDWYNSGRYLTEDASNKPVRP